MVEEIRYWPVRLVRQERVLYVLCRIDEDAAYEESNEPLLEEKPDWISYDDAEINKHRKTPVVLDGHEQIDELILEFFGHPAQHLSEVKFHSADTDTEKKSLTNAQVLEKSDDNNKAIHTRVKVKNIAYNYNFLTWLLGFGDQVKVISPLWLQNVLIKKLESSLNRYKN